MLNQPGTVITDTVSLYDVRLYYTDATRTAVRRAFCKRTFTTLDFDPPVGRDEAIARVTTQGKQAVAKAQDLLK